MQTEFPILGVRSEWLPLDDRRYTVQEYLAFERDEREKHMFLDGRVFEFNGEDWQHGGISVNVAVTVGIQLKATPFRTLTKRTCVYSGPMPPSLSTTSGMFFCPDVVVVAEAVHFDEFKDIILNPKAVFEVLSPATEAFDRSDKFTRLQTCNPTLTDYVLVSQDKPQVEHFQKQLDGTWSYSLHVGLDATVVIASIGVALNSVDVYDRVDFPKDEAAS